MRLISSCRLPVAAGTLLLLLVALFLFAPVPDGRKGAAVSEPTRISVYIPSEKRTVSMSLDEYIVGALAAEMPASYHLEALKAQALAARTRAYSSMRVFNGSGCALHSGADICADSAHCQGYITKSERRAKWGAEFEMYEKRLSECERDTRGEYMAYGGEPISVMYHASSGGITEASEAVFVSALPYLRSVKSEGEEEMRNYSSSAVFSLSELAEKLAAAFPLCAVTEENVRESVRVLSRSASGRVTKIRVGNEETDGRAFRAALSLPSTLFSISFDEENAVISSRGYGHGVGMSQAGANAMAYAGSDYREILAHYYTGIEILKME